MTNPSPSTPFTLPVVGPPNLANGDSGAGGQNDWASYQMMRPYLRRMIQTDYNPLFYGTSLTAVPIQAAMLDAVLAGGGTVHIPAGIWTIDTTLIMDSYIHLVGDGPNVTILRAKNGLNAPVIQGRNFATLTGSNNNSASASPGEWSIEGLTIDGNNAGNTSGQGIQVYGYGYYLTDVVVKNCAGDGIYSEWSTASDVSPFNDDLIARLTFVKVINNLGNGINWAGPHDSVMDTVVIYNSGNHDGHANLYVQNNAVMNGGGLSISNSHSSGNNADWGLRAESNVFCVNNQWEGSQTAMVWFTGSDASHMAQNSIMSGDIIYNAGAVAAPVGIEIGTAGIAPNMLHIRAMIVNCTSAALKFTNDGGFNRFDIVDFQSTGSTVVGTPSARSVVSMQKFGVGVPQTMVADHLLASGQAPALGALQTNVATQSVSGFDTRGKVTITTAGGGGPAAGAAVAILTFAQTFAATPTIILTGAPGVFSLSATGTGGFTINNAGTAALTAATTYVVHYMVIG